MDIKEVHITINVGDMDKAISFYTAIGFEVKARWENYYAKLQMSGMVLGLHPTAKIHLSEGSGNLSIGLMVQEMTEAKQLLKQKSIPFNERSEEGGHFLHFTDPDGNALYYINPKW